MCNETKPLVMAHTHDERIKEIAEGLIEWHGHRINVLREILAKSLDKNELEIKIADEEPLILKGKTLGGFALGIEVALTFFGKFPLAIEADGEEVLGDEECEGMA